MSSDMGRYLGLDFGSKTVGAALSDSLKTIASPLETIVRDREGKIRPTIRRIVELCRENDVELVVVGDPVHMDGSKGERSEKSVAFAQQLAYRLEQEGLEIPVVMQDERLTTVAADEILAESGVKATDRKQYIDKIAASIILEAFMAKATDNT